MNGQDEEDTSFPFRFRHLNDIVENEVTEQTRREIEAPLRYLHLGQDEQDLVNTVLHGGLSWHELPKIPPKVMKLYVSSAWKDFEVERNEFMQSVYPDLRNYCRNVHGIDFQAMDLRWGLSNIPEMFLPSTTACLNELRYCQETSMKPIFVSLLGHRYRRYAPPQEIEKIEYETMVGFLAGEGEEEDAILVDRNYREDTNAAPTTYRLQIPISSDESIQTAWSETLFRIQQILQNAADICFERGLLNSEACVRYRASEIEQEIENGILAFNPKQRATNCLLFSRTFKDKDLIIQESDHNVYLNRFPDGQDDVEADTLINDLRDVTIESLTSNNVVATEIEGTKNGIIEHQEYMKKITQRLYCSVKTMIDDFMRQQNPLHDEKLLHEVVQHWKVVEKASKIFVARDELLMNVKKYIMSETDQPLVIIGESGSGKTAAVAKVVHDVNIAIRNKDLAMRTALVYRFIGHTANTKTTQQLLHSVCQHIAFVIGKNRHEVPSDYKALKLYFIDLVQRGEFGGMMLIILDGLERLSSSDHGHKLEWLPSRVAPNVKIITTANAEYNDTIELLQNKCRDNIVEILPFTSSDCENIMKVFMNTSKLSVAYNQWTKIKSAFKTCTLPLFIQLTLEEVKNWCSYHKSSDIHLGESVEECIQQVFDRVERTHGSVLVSHVLGYLAASGDGLSESELLDVLSIDEVVLNDVFTRWHPPIRRMPPALLALIRQDLSPYLEEREVDGIAVLCWGYSQFPQVARKRYLKDNNFAMYLHSNIADYYLGTWSGSARKKFTYSSEVTSLLNKKTAEDEACRFLPEQPLFFGTTDMDERYNLRKMTLLPNSLLQSDRHESLRSDVFCNFNYLYYRIKSSSIQQLLIDFDMFQDRECTLVADALKLSMSAISHDLNSLGVELTGRLLPHAGRYKSIRDLIYQCDLQSQKSCPLIPICQCYCSPGGPLQYECDVGGHSHYPIDLDVYNCPDGILLTAKPYYSSRVRVWELSRGEPRPDIVMPTGDIYPTRDGKFLNVFQNDRSIKIFRSDCGEVHGEVEYGYGVVSDIDVSHKYMAFTVDKGTGPYVIDIENSSQIHKFNYHSQAVAISPNDTYLVCNSNRSVILFELPLMQRKCVAEASDVPIDIILIGRKLKCCILTMSKTIETIQFDTISKKSKVNSIFSDLEIKQCILSHTENLFLVRSGKCLHVVDTETDKLLRKLSELPDGIIVDPKSNFTGAGFTPNDEMIVAARYTFLALWDAKTGCPVRVLLSTAMPIQKMFTSNVVNKCVSLLENNTFQVWDLDNIDTDILHSNEIFQSSVKGVAVSPESKRVVCFDGKEPEAKILNLRDGQVTDILQHSYDSDDKLMEVVLSANGRYVITRAQKVDYIDGNDGIWDLLRDDIIWDLEQSQKTFHATSGRYAMFTKNSNLAILITCIQHSQTEWTDNIYHMVLVYPSTGNIRHLDFPYSTEFVSKPQMLTQNNLHYFVSVVQQCKRSVDQDTGKELNKWDEIRLLIKNLSSPNQENVLLRIQNIIESAGDKDQFIDVMPLPDDTLILTYGKNMETLSFDEVYGMVRPTFVEKGAIIYNVEREECLKHIETFLQPSSDIHSILVSRKCSAALDSNLYFFTSRNFGNGEKLKIQVAPGTARLALDGKYVVALSPRKMEVLVFRTDDSVMKARVFVHGTATCLEIGSDDRTVVVGCDDGRVMILSLVLNLSDPMRELIEKLPSRTLESGDTNQTNGVELIKRDVRQMECRTPDLARLSARIRSKHSDERKPPNHQTVSNAVMVTQQMSQTRSEACCIQ